MAFTVTQRASSTNTTSSSQTLVSSSFTPTANSRLFVFAVCERDAHISSQSWSISNTGSLSFTKLDESTIYDWNGDTNYATNTVAYYADVGASPTSMTVTVDPFDVTETGFISLIAFDVTGYDTGTPFAQASVDNGAQGDAGDSVSGTLTLGSTPTNGNLVCAMFGVGNDVDGAASTPTGYTALVSQSQSYTHAAVFYHTSTTTAAVTSSDLGQSVGNWGGVIFEMTLASGGDGSVTAVTATSTAAGVAPTLSGAASITSTVGTATAAGVAPTITVSASITATVAAATAAGVAPSLSYGQTVTATVGTATGAGLAPAITVTQTVISEIATATAAGIAPEVTATAGAQLAYAIADSYVGNWTGEGGETSNLYTHIDETTASDSDYVKSEETPSSSPFVVQLGSLTDPADDTNHVLSYRYLKSATGQGTINLTVQLRQNYTNEGSPGDLIAQWQHNDIGAVTQNDGTLTAGEAGSISAYSALFVRFVADSA